MRPNSFSLTVRVFAAVISILLYFGMSNAQEAPAGHVERVATRDAASVPLYTYWRDDAVATIVLFSGGGGGYGQIGADGWPGGGNFLIRTGKRWATHPFNIVMVGRPSDGIDLSLGWVRTGEKHMVDTIAILKYIKLKSQLPIWTVGTSMGTISVAAAAIQDRENLISGVVLTSTILAYKIPGAVPKQRLDAIRVPTLIVHHNNDACWACSPFEAIGLENALKHAPAKKTIMVTGGIGVTGDPCEPMHHHGYVGQQDEVVNLIAAWIINPAK